MEDIELRLFPPPLFLNSSSRAGGYGKIMRTFSHIDWRYPFNFSPFPFQTPSRYLRFNFGRLVGISPHFFSARLIPALSEEFTPAVGSYFPSTFLFGVPHNQ